VRVSGVIGCTGYDSDDDDEQTERHTQVCIES
jgi:hypothetical protein